MKRKLKSLLLASSGTVIAEGYVFYQPSTAGGGTFHTSSHPVPGGAMGAVSTMPRAGLIGTILKLVNHFSS